MAGVLFSFSFAFCQTCSVSLTNVDSNQIRLVPNKWRICSGHTFIVASEQESAKLRNIRLICRSGFILPPCCQVPRGSVFNLPYRDLGVLRKTPGKSIIEQLLAAFEEISAETVLSELVCPSSVKNNDQTQGSLRLEQCTLTGLC